MSSLSIPSNLAFPIIDIDSNNDCILILDHSQNLWSFKNILERDIEIRKVVKEKVKNFKCWGSEVIIYIENNELLTVCLDSYKPSPVKPGLCISVSQIA